MKTNLFGWFDDQSAEALKRLIKEHRIKTVVEIGTLFGKSTAFFCENVKEVRVVDPFDMSHFWGDLPEELKGVDMFSQFYHNMKNLGYWGTKVLAVFRGKSQDENVIKDVPKADLIYIDGDHSYEAVKSDIINYIPKAKKLICGDDYDDLHPDVQEAVDELLPDRKVEGRLWYFIKDK